MRFSDIFNDKKPVIAMLHLKAGADGSVLSLAKEEIEIFYSNGVDAVLVENYFGGVNDCEAVLEYLREKHKDKIYGVNILGDYKKAFALAKKYGAKFIQIDSVCGHLNGNADSEYGESLKKLRADSQACILGGVRFKYQPVCSGRSLEEDLKIGMERCDAVVITGGGTGVTTPKEKMEQFRNIAGDFPLITGAGVTIENITDAMAFTNGVIIGSWLKENHNANGNVSVKYVSQFVTAADTINGVWFENMGKLDDAFNLYKRNADRGDALSKRFIANLYFHKKYRSIQVSPAEKAVKNILAGKIGSVMPWEQSETEPDYKEAFKWHLNAAESGIAESMSDAGVMLYYGAGCEKNIDEAKKWLGKAVSEGVEYAVKAYADFFGEMTVEHISDGEYMNLVKEFECFAAAGNEYECAELHKKLILGTERQLAKFGYALAKGKYKYGGLFDKFHYPQKQSGEPYAPVYKYLRCPWYFSVLKVTLDCFEEENPIITCASDINGEIIPVKWTEKLDAKRSYNSGKYGWMDDEKKCFLIRIDKNLPFSGDLPSDFPAYIHAGYLAEAIQKIDADANEAVFIEVGEKEYSVEICHLTTDNEFVVLDRYII